MDVTKLSVEELKSLAYDQIAALEQTQANLRILNDEIIKRNQAVEPKQEIKEAKKK